MTRRRRSEILVRGNPELSEKLARTIFDRYEVKEVQAPVQSLVMVKIRESGKRSLFYGGEVLVNEAKMALGNSIGLGILQDDDRVRGQKRAVELAVLDAAFKENLAETRDWLPLLEEEEKKILADAREEKKRVLRTRVAFETMDREAPL